MPLIESKGRIADSTLQLRNFIDKALREHRDRGEGVTGYEIIALYSRDVLKTERDRLPAGKLRNITVKTYEYLRLLHKHKLLTRRTGPGRSGQERKILRLKDGV